MPLSTPDEVFGFLDALILRSSDIYHLLPTRLRQLARFPYMSALLDELGHPENGLRVAHVSGTNGKGSTATLIAAMAHAAGIRTGLYTSPYVTVPQERIQIDGKPIADDLFVQCANEVIDGLTRFKARFPHFEPHLKMVWVALMLVAFARAGVELAIVEVGMGGRYDETNVVHPATATIVTVGFDHMQSLGDTLPEIAFHKAGIIKPGAVAISGVTAPEAGAIIAAEAQLAGSPLATLTNDFAYDNLSIAPHGTTFDYHDAQTGELSQCHLRLIGRHYGHNAALAIRTARRLIPSMNNERIRAGLQRAWLPGRFEIIGERPKVLLDVAHNPEKLGALAETVQMVFPEMPIWLVLGAMENKDTNHFLPAIKRLHPTLTICTEPTMRNRAVTKATDLASQLSADGLAATSVPNPKEAVQRAINLASCDDLVLVTGSLYLVSEVRPYVLTASQIT